MNFEDKINRIEENKKIKRRLNELGIYPSEIQKMIGPTGPKGDQGPTGPQGTGITIEGSYNTVDELKENHPTGVVGDCFVVQGILYVWDIDDLEWKSIGNIQGPKGEKGDPGPKGEKGEQGPIGMTGDSGISESIVIDGTHTLDSNEKAEVIDDVLDNTHHLTFYIPKGEKGDVGAGAGATAYNGIIYVGYQDATDSRALTIKEKILIPDSTKFFEIPTVINIDIKTTGIYEIMLCGKISGVTQDNGAKFFLLNITTGTVINNLTFELNEGDTSNMTFAGTTITEIFAPATFQVKTSISNDPTTSQIKFSDIG